MSVRHGDGDTILLEGCCPLDDAEPLLRLLLERPGAAVDLRACEAMHTGVAQVLLYASAPVIGPARGKFVRKHVAPLLDPAHR